MTRNKLALLAACIAQPKAEPLTTVAIVEAWRTTEAPRSKLGWGACEWFYEGVRFAERAHAIAAATKERP